MRADTGLMVASVAAGSLILTALLFVGTCAVVEYSNKPPSGPSPLDPYFDCVSRCTHGTRSHWGEAETRECLTVCKIHALPKDATTEEQ